MLSCGCHSEFSTLYTLTSIELDLVVEKHMFASHSSARVMRAFFSKCTQKKKTTREKKRLIHPSTLFHSISRVSNTEGTEGTKRCIEAPLLQSSYTPFANYTVLQLQHPASAYSIQLIVFHWSFVVHLMSHKFAVYARLCAIFRFVVFRVHCWYVHLCWDVRVSLCVCGEVQRLMRILYYSLWTHIIEPIHSVKDKQLEWTANIFQRQNITI